MIEKEICNWCKGTGMKTTGIAVYADPCPKCQGSGHFLVESQPERAKNPRKEFYAEVLDLECKEYDANVSEFLISEGKDPEGNDDEYVVSTECFPKDAFVNMGLKDGDFVKISYFSSPGFGSVEFRKVDTDMSHLFNKRDFFRDLKDSAFFTQG